MNDRSVLADISPQLPNSERAYMYGIMSDLSPHERKNVIVFDVASGKLHANKPSLLALARFWRGVLGQPGLLRDPRGETMRVTDDTMGRRNQKGLVAHNLPNVCEGTGFCHSRYSDYNYAEHKGWTWEDVSISFPCSSANLVKGDGGFGYIGLLDNSSADNQPSVDAGLQAIDGADGIKASLQMNMFVNGPLGKSGVSISVPANQLLCPVNADMTYHNGTGSHKNHYFYLNVSAQFVQGGSLTIVGNATNSGYLFPEDCLCQVKTVTSIATSNLNSLDGSSFGAEDLNSSPVPELQWFGAQKGYYSNDSLVPGGGLVEYNNSPGQLGTAPIILCVPNASNDSTDETTGVNLATNVSQNPSTFCPR